MSESKKIFQICVLLLTLPLVVDAALAQQVTDTVQGRVFDLTGGVIPGATVTVTDSRGNTRTLTTDETGAYVFRGLAPGRYTVRAFFRSFAPYENTAVEITAGRVTILPISLSLAAIEQEITLLQETPFRGGAVALPGSDFEALPEDLDDLAADLEALSGASAGPQGTQLFVDGFSGGRLPSKTSIREFRTNQNPFSAAYDRVGFGRIEVFTKPGSDKFRGEAFFNFGDGYFNARNPFYASKRPVFQERLLGGRLSGPLKKRASFSVDLERRELDAEAVISATILDPALNVTPLRQEVFTPQRRISMSPRVDYQWSQNHTLVARYMYTHMGRENAGIGDFSLLSRAYNTSETEHLLQLTETALLSSRVINETRLQFVRTATDQLGDNSVPTISVSEAFTGGGSEIGHSFLTQDRWEFQNNTYFVLGAHSLRWGGRLRSTSISDISPQNFGGTFRFSGGSAPQLDMANQVVRDTAGQPVLASITPIERYRRTLLFQGEGLTAEQIRALGGGATQFSITAGDPKAEVSQVDLGVFMQDDWRIRPNFLLGLGLRYEAQNNIPDWKDFAPRIRLAWAPGASERRKTTVRVGFGTFYDRFSEKLTLQAIRLNGLNQQQYVVRNPDFFPTAPPVQTLTAQPTIRRVASDLRAPYIMETSIGIERLLPFSTTIASTFSNFRGLHLLRSRNINAPLPGTFVPGISTSGIRPYGSGTVFLYESVGVLNQRQWNTTVNSRFNRNVTLFALYLLNYANSSTDGPTTFPADSYDDSMEYGRSVLDERHRFVLGASILGPRGFKFSPFIVARSGVPFNITTGVDANGDTLLTDRPGFAADLIKDSAIVTPFGAFNPNPTPEKEIIPRNYGFAPGYFTVNLRLSRTFGFGSKSEKSKGGTSSGEEGGMRSILTDTLSEKRYNLIFSVSVRNLLNHTNPGTLIGNLTSPFFGNANTLADSYGPAAGAGNRRVEMQLRLKF
ncbi:MAG: carboxypeptidase regulatory-like domain-containing protein [Acidobacteria bacterium]|nr:carboxypeptidase regulatory-like domain-containing protein [Acidobacteriota bacterium]